MFQPTQNALPEKEQHHEVQLPTGLLTVDVHESDFALDELAGFAARYNPKRGFLFVSKVLGKHIPVRPSLMREVHSRLAAKIPADLPGPVVVIGMAETAIGLGQGVHDRYVELTGRHDVVFCHSTRYRLDRPVSLKFLEEHSHAADHIVYEPEEEQARSFYHNAGSLVLIDDEASTGKTFVNLAKAFKAEIPSIRRIVTAVITDWRGPERRRENQAVMPAPYTSVAILTGRYQFSAAPNLVAVEMPKVVGNGQSKDSLLPRNHGRLGLTGSYAPGRRFCARDFGIEPGDKVLVLGTGEFAHPPFKLAEMLEADGVNVVFQSTTRSPIMVGNAIACALEFRDNYADEIPNYVYNVDSERYDRVLIVHETPAGSLDSDLVDALGAQTVEL